MEHLWAPWRMEYIKGVKTGECIFCALPPERQDERNRILLRGASCFVIMNTYPYSNGHLMVCPYRHLSCITLLNAEEAGELWQMTRHCVEILRAQYRAEGFNVGFNMGKAGGAGYDEHIHTHIVPRWTGDTNFMPALADVKVHPEHLSAGYAQLHPFFQKLAL